MYTSSAKNRLGSVKLKEGKKNGFHSGDVSGLGSSFWANGNDRREDFCVELHHLKSSRFKMNLAKKSKQTKNKTQSKFEHVPLATGVGGVKYAVRLFSLFLKRGFGHSG